MLCGKSFPKKINPNPNFGSNRQHLNSKHLKFHQYFNNVEEWKGIERRTDDTFRQVNCDADEDNKGKQKRSESSSGSGPDGSDSQKASPLIFPTIQHARQCIEQLTQEQQEMKKEDTPDNEKSIEEYQSNTNNDMMKELFTNPSIIKTTPRPYQIQAYLRSLLQDHIIVLPTGTGKTLIATLILTKLQILNPNRMGLFVVDRVPLVFQQGNYISSETNGQLRVCMICGENCTPAKIREIKTMQFDVLCITAGSLWNLVTRNQLNLDKDFHCMILDECHHAKSGHPYCKLLTDVVVKSTNENKPRIVGLSASPVGLGSSYDETVKGLDKLCANFAGGRSSRSVGVFSPGDVDSSSASTHIEEVIIKRTTLHEQYCVWIISRLEEFKSLLNSIINCLSPSLPPLTDMKLSSFETGIAGGLLQNQIVFEKFCHTASLGRIRGDLNTLRTFLYDEEHLLISLASLKDSALCLINTMKGIIGALEVTEVLGLSKGMEIISSVAQMDKNYIFDIGSESLDMNMSSDIRRTYETLEKGFGKSVVASESISLRIQRLNHELRKVKKQMNAESRVLVIVHSRSIARDLHSYLNSNAVKDIKDYFNPQLLVGHGGYDGMMWEGEQQVALEKFRAGLSNEMKDGSRLIVATSVIEEGLDVAECNVVIRLQGLQSMISFIQSRGRARRADHSKMLIFVSENDKAHVHKVRDGEILMQQIVKQRDNGLTSNDSVLQVEKELLRQCHHYQSSWTHANNVNARQYTDSLSYCAIDSLPPLTMWVTNTGPNRSLIDIEVFESELQSSLESSGSKFVLVTNIVLIDCSPLEHIFSHSIGYLVHLSFADEESTLDDWDYRVGSETVWIQRDVTPIETKNDISCDLVGISSGCWLEHDTFGEINVMNHVNNSNLNVQFQHNAGFHIWFHMSESLSITIDVSTSCMHPFLLICDNIKEDLVRVFISLRHPPKIYSHASTNTQYPQRVHDYNEWGEFWKCLCTHNVLCLSFRSIEKDKLLGLQSHYLCVPMYETNVLITENYIGGDEFRLHDSNNKLLIDLTKQRIPSSPQLSSNIMKEIQWIFLSLISQRLGCFTPLVKESMWEKIMSICNGSSSDSTSLEISSLRFALHRCFDVSYWANIKHIFSSSYNSSMSAKGVDSPSGNYFFRPNKSIDCCDNLFKLNRVILTPTRKAYQVPIYVKGCRLFRKYGTNNFILVSYRDDCLQQRLWGKSSMHHVISSISNEINLCGEEKYVFFGASNSQFREQKVLFVAVNEEFGVNISRNATDRWLKLFRSKIVQPQEPLSPAKYLSKLALFCSADLPTIILDGKDVTFHSDVMTSMKDSILTDGSGKIAVSVASDIALNHLGLDEVPSAFQIRWQGAKGIVTVVEDQHIAGWKMVLCQSMKKCDAKESTLCVVDYSRYFPMKLNREIITLLSSIDSDKFDPSPKLKELLENALSDETEYFMNTEKGYETIKIELENDVKIYFDTSYEYGDLLSNPLWIEILQTRYACTVNDLLDKMQIPVKDGCRLIGIPDPLGVLNDGEIFVKIDRDDKEEVIEQEDVLVWRNPCLYPGDARLVQAVDKTALHRWSNVIIFPCHERCSRNLPLECSGGDLDGDQFYILWDRGLIPPRSTEFPALDYNKLQDDTAEETEMKRWEEQQYHSNHQLASFIAEIFENSFLGKIATWHLALSDSQELGAQSSICIELAKQQSYAVDFPKTGKPPLIPKKARELIEKNGYPDFMRKSIPPDYESQKILGKLFRRVQWFTTTSTHEAAGSQDTLLDHRLLLVGREKYIALSRQLLNHYSDHIQYAASLFGTSSEAEMLLGRPIMWTDHHASNKSKSSKALKAYFTSIRQYFQQVVTSYIGSLSIDEQEKAASACYEMSHKMKSVKSFCIIISNLLGQILRGTKRYRPNSSHQLNLRCGSKILSYFEDSVAQTGDVMKTRLLVKDLFQSLPKLKYLWDKLSLDISVFGSVGQALCFSEESDLDLVIHSKYAKDQKISFSSASKISLEEFLNLPLKSREEQFLSMQIFDAMEDISSSVTSVMDTPVPIVRGFVDSRMISAGGSHIGVEICTNISGLLKTQWLQKIFLEDPTIYVVFNVLMRWLRSLDLLKCNDISNPFSKTHHGSTRHTQSILSVSEGHALILFILEEELHEVSEKCKKEWVRDYDQNKLLCSPESSTFMDLFKNLNDSQSILQTIPSERVGCFIFSFFTRIREYYRHKSNGIRYYWPTPKNLTDDAQEFEIPGSSPSICNQICHEVLEILGFYCGPALQSLLIHNKFDQLILSTSLQDVCTFSRKISGGLGYRISSSAQFYATFFSRISGCEVNIEQLPKARCIIVKASGTRNCLIKLKEKIYEMGEYSSNRKRLKRFQTSKYFMDGASGMCLVGSTETTTQLQFNDVGGAIFNLSMAALQYAKQSSVCRTSLKEDGHYDKIHTSPLKDIKEKNSNCISVQGAQYAVSLMHRTMINALEVVLRRQITSLDREKSNFNEIKLSLSFGHFVVVNRHLFLPETRRTLSVEELLNGMMKRGRSRKQWKRQEPSGEVKRDEGKGSRVEKQSKSHNILRDPLKEKKQKSKGSTPGIPTTFVPTFGGVDKNQAGNDTVLSLAMKVESAVLSCGYTPQKESDGNWLSDGMKSNRYFISYQMSRAHELKASYDDNENQERRNAELIQERSLNWAHFTLLGDGKLPDGRVRLISNQNASTSLKDKVDVIHKSPLYWEKEANDDTEDDCSTEFGQDAVPRFHDDIPESTRDKITFVNRYCWWKHFEKTICGYRIKASITQSYHFWPDLLNDNSFERCPCCHLQLEFLSDIFKVPTHELCFIIILAYEEVGIALNKANVPFTS